MKISVRNILILSAALLISGVVLGVGALASVGFDFAKMNTVNMVNLTHMPDDSFDRIRVEGENCNVSFVVGTDCRVESRVPDTVDVSTLVDNGCLTISCTDTLDSLPWYRHLGIYTETPTLTVYLTPELLRSLQVQTISGDISLPKALEAEQVEACATSGSIRCEAQVRTDLNLRSTSGDIFVGRGTPERIAVQTTSGDVRLQYITSSQRASVSTVSGDVRLDEISGKNLSVSTTSGSIELFRCNGSTGIQLSSVSGEITGSLTGRCFFLARTTSGDVDVPANDILIPSPDICYCEVRTTSGDISLETVS